MAQERRLAQYTAPQCYPIRIGQYPCPDIALTLA